MVDVEVLQSDKVLFIRQWIHVWEDIRKRLTWFEADHQNPHSQVTNEKRPDMPQWRDYKLFYNHLAMITCMLANTKSLLNFLVCCAHSWDIELNTRREINRPHLQTTMYYFVYYINAIGLYWQGNTANDLWLRMVNAFPFVHHPDRVVWKASDMSAANWRYQTHVKIVIVLGIL